MKGQKVIGIDLGGTKAALAVIDNSGRLIEATRFDVDVPAGPANLLNTLALHAQTLVSRHKGIRAVGLATAGPIDLKRGLIVNPTNFPGWKTVRMVSTLERKLNLPVGFDNDAAGAALAELWIGAGKKVSSLVCMTLGTGVGTGLVINRRIFRGGTGFAGEGGHLIITRDNWKCGCGATGCTETCISGSAYGRRVSLRKNAVFTGREAIALLEAGDMDARTVMQEYIQDFAVALHNYSVAYSPELIVITGGFSEAHRHFLEPAVRQLGLMMQRKKFLLPKVKLSPLGNTAGMTGAGYIAFQKLGVFGS